MKNIYDKLKIANLNPYFIGQHKGLCKDNFLVIKEGNQMPSIRSNRLGQKVIDIIVFVPEKSYVRLGPYMQEIRLALKELDYLRKTGLETEAVADDEKKAYTASIQYTIIKKLEG